MEKYSARQHFFGCRGAWRDEGATATARTGWDEPVTVSALPTNGAVTPTCGRLTPSAKLLRTS